MNTIITIDGPSGAGKSTIAKLLAQKLGYTYLDTGALYRAVAWKVRHDNADPDDSGRLQDLLGKIDITLSENKIIVNGTDVTSMIRTPEISELSSKVSAVPAVRKHLFKLQREIGLKGRVVLEGRDTGTVIFPEAENKFFLDAGPEERGRRRYKELKGKSPEATLKETIDGIKTRDERDSTRQSAPLKRTDDMIYIDTSNLTIEQVIAKIMGSLKIA
ncbi:MAG: (d)CMP kinase [Nitrospirae bacterium]|nr:(d)CMP kinase [Nitrospirota bacterium]MBI4838019.1 (d)CMP kinase [Nitrospirota bacterium]